MEAGTRKLDILLVEDNPADVRLIQEAFKDSRLVGNFSIAGDGEAALDHLSRHR